MNHGSRDSYPRFRTLGESVTLQATWFGHGLQDSFQWLWLTRTLYHDLEIRTNLFKSLLLNTCSLLSIYAVETLFSPHFQGQSRWGHAHLGSLYNLLWLSPILATSFYLNSTWCQIIAQRAFTLQHGGRSSLQPPMSYRGMINAIASSAYRFIMLSTSLLISLCLGLVPVVGLMLSFVFLCWTNSYYCFEFLWIARGFSLHRRIRHLEERWAYYLAFGAPSAFLCTSVSGLAGVAVFALIFPTYIMMASHAIPLPTDPYNPTASSAGGGTQQDVPIHPSPFIPIRLPIFALVLWLDDKIVQVFRVGSPTKVVKPTKSMHYRSFSDASEQVEDGRMPTYVQSRVSQRINIGRSKQD